MHTYINLQTHAHIYIDDPPSVVPQAERFQRHWRRGANT